MKFSAGLRNTPARLSVSQFRYSHKMKIQVLGSAAGGGFPQWNCNCDNCAGYRNGSLNAKARTQSSICISSNGVDWALINASPDIRQQIIDFPPLQPGRNKRDTGIRGVVLMDSQIDHTTGLLMLRELAHPLPIYCTDMVRQDLTTGFPVMNMLSHYCDTSWREIQANGAEFEVEGVENITFRGIYLSSKAPPYSPHRQDPHPGDNIGILVEDQVSGGKLFYAPGLGVLETHLMPFMHQASCLLVDGTCWLNDEMSTRGVGEKRATEMGHLYQFGEGGMIEQLEQFPEARKILIHINNTNPILNEDGVEREILKSHSIEVAWDGMEITL